MGVFDRLFRKNKKNTPKKNAAATGTASAAAEEKAAESVFSDADYRRSQVIYDRSLLGISTFEIHCIPSESKLRSHLYYGELKSMTDGLMTLRVIAKRSSDALFVKNGQLSLTFTKYGEAFYAIARIVDTQISGFGTGSVNVGAGMMPWKYNIQLVLCEEPVRHHRKHGRVSIDWDVFYMPVKDGQDGLDTSSDDFRANCFKARTRNVSEGGFKGTIDRQLEVDTLIKCVVDVGFDEVSKGNLIGKIVRCYPLAYDTGTYEMTVSFIEMDDSVREFLNWWITQILPAPVNAQAVTSISEGGLDASLELIPPKNHGEDLTYDELCKELESKGVKHGVDFGLLKSIADAPRYNNKYIIARCTPSVHGEDAVLSFNVDMNPSFTPKIDERGEVDFKELGQIHKVIANEILVKKTPPTTGTPGTAVTGEALESITGKDALFPAGANTITTEDDTALLAATDGYISIIDGKINVLDTYVVEGDVQYTTGNIDHNGIVIVKGDVRQGFTVTATGDVIVHGTVESATVKAGGTLVVQGGCVGEKNHLEVDGNTAVMFIDGGNFIIKGSLTTSYILNSTVRCGDMVEMVNSGLIRNSHVIAKTGINAKTIGSTHSAADNTVVEAGNDPELLAKYNSICEELDSVNKELESARANINGLVMQKQKGQLSGKMQETLDFTKNLANQLSERQRELQDEYETLEDQIDELGYGFVTVSDIAYGGFKVIIGTREMTLLDSVMAAKFQRRFSGIEIVPID